MCETAVTIGARLVASRIYDSAYAHVTDKGLKTDKIDHHFSDCSPVRSGWQSWGGLGQGWARNAPHLHTPEATTVCLIRQHGRQHGVYTPGSLPFTGEGGRLNQS